MGCEVFIDNVKFEDTGSRMCQITLSVVAHQVHFANVEFHCVESAPLHVSERTIIDNSTTNSTKKPSCG